jgi:hypothetical protein
VLSNVEKILNFFEEDSLQADVIQPVDLRQLDGILDRASSRSYAQGVDVTKAITTLHGKGVYRYSTRSAWIIGIIIMFLSVGTLWLIWFKFISKHCSCMWKCTLVPKQPSMSTLTQPLNTNATGLQITPGENGG